MNFLLAIILLHIFLCLKKPIYGLCSLISIRLLIPIFVRAGIGSISLNTFALVILALVVYVKNREHLSIRLLKRQDFKYIKSFCVGLFILIFFAEMPIVFQFKALLQFFITEILPAVLAIIIIQSKSELKSFIYTLVVCYFISGLYGLFTLYIGGNPYYQLFVLKYGNTEMLLQDFSDLSGRAKGGLEYYAAGMTTGGPLVWSQTTMLVAAYFLETRNLLNKGIYVPLFMLLLSNCFLTGQRSSFFALSLALFYLFWSLITVKMVTKSLLVIFLFLFVLELVPQLKTLKSNIYSTFLFFDDQLAAKNDVGGSSMDLRLQQTEATFMTLFQYPIAGRGYSWPSYQGEKNNGSIDPIMAGYESILFNVGWSSGVTGLIIWAVFLLRCLRLIKCKDRQKYKLRKAFWLSYMISCLATGIQSTFFMFLVLIVLCCKETELTEN